MRDLFARVKLTKSKNKNLDLKKTAMKGRVKEGLRTLFPVLQAPEAATSYAKMLTMPNLRDIYQQRKQEIAYAPSEASKYQALETTLPALTLARKGGGRAVMETLNALTLSDILSKRGGLNIQEVQQTPRRMNIVGREARNLADLEAYERRLAGQGVPQSAMPSQVREKFPASFSSGRPWHQQALEDAMAQKDMARIRQILDSIKMRDPYKMSMESIFRPKVERAGKSFFGRLFKR